MGIVVVVGLTLIAGMVGGAVGYAGASAAWRRGVKAVDVDLEVDAQVIQRSVQAKIPVTFDVPPVRIVVPVEIETVQPVGSKAEMAAKILAEAPAIGVREMARILDVSPSTASGYMSKCSPELRSGAEHLGCSDAEQSIALAYEREVGK